jgi:dTDP-4-dehydrorhamnose 3,5-epimerase
MLFTETALKGAFLVELDTKPDPRGFFARSWCVEEAAAHGLNPQVVQCNISFNTERGTLRGLHWQAAPRAEVKLVRVTRGAIFDVVCDLRPESPTFKRYLAVELSAENRRALYIPEGFAHGFQTLMDATEVYYQMSEIFSPEFARGARWDDPAFGVRWPIESPTLSDRDRNWPPFAGASGNSSSASYHALRA